MAMTPLVPSVTTEERPSTIASSRAGRPLPVLQRTDVVPGPPPGGTGFGSAINSTPRSARAVIGVGDHTATARTAMRNARAVSHKRTRIAEVDSRRKDGSRVSVRQFYQCVMVR